MFAFNFFLFFFFLAFPLHAEPDSSLCISQVQGQCNVTKSLFYHDAITTTAKIRNPSQNPNPSWTSWCYILEKLQ